MSDAMKGVNLFLDRIPTELHEQYVKDLMTELMKLIMAETNKDGDISLKYGRMVAFARKI
jgi:hypothetical protein